MKYGKTEDESRLERENEELRRQLAELEGMRQFNGLSPAEHERLTLIFEEASEVVQSVAKVLRHGYHSGHRHYGPGTNRDHLERELGQLEAVIALAVARSDLNGTSVHRYARAKLRDVQQYLHHNTTEGVTE
jgi:regulator of replication initiation timing